jgi:hypothetical protein
MENKKLAPDFNCAMCGTTVISESTVEELKEQFHQEFPHEEWDEDLPRVCSPCFELTDANGMHDYRHRNVG